jgi:hypothetical protein
LTVVAYLTVAMFKNSNHNNISGIICNTLLNDVVGGDVSYGNSIVLLNNVVRGGPILI